MKVTKKDLINKAMEIENNLIRAGFNVKVENYFAYGGFGYYFNFKGDEREHRQLYTGLSSKKECYIKLVSTYYKVLVNASYYKFKDNGENYIHG